MKIVISVPTTCLSFFICCTLVSTWFQINVELFWIGTFSIRNINFVFKTRQILNFISSGLQQSCWHREYKPTPGLEKLKPVLSRYIRTNVHLIRCVYLWKKQQENIYICVMFINFCVNFYLKNFLIFLKLLIVHSDFRHTICKIKTMSHLIRKLFTNLIPVQISFLRI